MSLNLTFFRCSRLTCSCSPFCYLTGDSFTFRFEWFYRLLPKGTMVKYFCCAGLLKCTWDQACVAYWQRYPNPYSNHVLTEDIIFREVTPSNCLISRRLMTKTSRAPRWMERYLPKHMSSLAYVIEDSIVDPQKRTMTTLTWNITHARLMSVEERCVYGINSENSNWTEIKREAWISSKVYGLSRAIQEFGLARFKTSATKTMKGFEYILAKMQGTTL
ncbi:PRELI domain containing 1a isoform X2 [Gadus chalcogrammus]|uniref:PRELI domain containing 1a isoform X2 n=1 Tax=Gadus chalcogrammus TaxID=1042646 RepID=UPI0024C487CF|nr:PRELI domain containing 1a isoform X2 [Gadus chalcogrammus]